MPEDGVHKAVGILLEFPAEARLSDTRRARDYDKTRQATLDRCVEEVLYRAQLGIAADERGFEAVDTLLSADAGEHADRPPELFGAGFTFQEMLAGVVETDRAR